MKLSKDKSGQIVDFLTRQIPEIKAIYLFGSYAQGEATKFSDIDIAI